MGFNPLSANPRKWSTHSNNSSVAAYELSVFDHFVELALKGLTFSCIMLKNCQTCFKNLAVNYLFITALNFSQITACKSRYKSVFFPIFLLSFMYYTKTVRGTVPNKVAYWVEPCWLLCNLFHGYKKIYLKRNLVSIFIIRRLCNAVSDGRGDEGLTQFREKEWT